MSIVDRPLEHSGPPRVDGFPVGAYLTDGRRLLHVERRTQAVGGGAVVEVEDCMTFELSSWSARSLARLGFRWVRPKEAAVGEGERTVP
jgi:hypothetical protein